MSNPSRRPLQLPAALITLLAVLVLSPSVGAAEPDRDPDQRRESAGERDPERHRPTPNAVAAPDAEAEQRHKPTDQPEGALAHFLKRRQPVTTREQGRGLDYSLYESAMAHSRLMPVVSSARPPRTGDPNAPDATTAVPWTPIGPGNIGGRTLSWVFDPGNPATMYTGTAGGGIWKTTNSGSTWTPIGDLLANLAIASLAIAPGGTTLYAGTGEGAFNVDGIRGAGIFKSTDSGATWTQLANTANSNFYYVNDLVISPNSASTLYAATRTGVWRSLDAGVTWTQFAETTGHVGGCFDLVVKPATSPDTVFAACGSFYSGSFSKPTAAVYRNTNANGAGTFTSVLSNTGMARTSLAIAPSATNTIYAVAACSTPASGFTCNFEDGLRAVYRSTDGGGTWTTQYDRSPRPPRSTRCCCRISAWRSARIRRPTGRAGTTTSWRSIRPMPTCCGWAASTSPVPTTAAPPGA
ncbi:MAG: sialidase family protein [Gemmataceae bacterium]